MLIDPAISLTIALSVALLFAAAASHKVRGWQEFQAVLRNYDLVPGRMVPGFAALLIALESGVALLLLFSATRGVGAVMSCALLTLYAVAMAINLARGRVNLDCGCVGFGRRQPIRPWMVVRNLAIGAVVLVAKGPTTARTLEALDIVSISGAVISVALLYVAHGLLESVPRTVRGHA